MDGILHRDGEVTDFVHGVVEAFDNTVGGGAGVPGVEGEFADRVEAGGADDDFFLRKEGSGDTDAGEDIILGREDVPTLLAEGRDKAGGGGVDNDLLDGVFPGEFFQIGGIFEVGFLAADFFGIVVEFFDAEPGAVFECPESHRGRVDGAIVAGDTPLLEGAFWDRLEPGFVPEVVDTALRGGPFTEYISLVENAVEGLLITLEGSGVEGRVIGHGEVEVEKIVLLFFLDPFLKEPMLGGIGVTGEPEFSIWDGAAGKGLLDKGFWHEDDFIQEDTGEGNTLNEGSTVLVFSAKEVENIGVSSEADGDLVFGVGEFAGEAEGLEDREEGMEEVAVNGGDGFAAEGELLIVEGAHSPAEKGEAEAESFATAGGAVAEDGVAVMERGVMAPPGQDDTLFGREGADIQVKDPPR